MNIVSQPVANLTAGAFAKIVIRPDPPLASACFGAAKRSYELLLNELLTLSGEGGLPSARSLCVTPQRLTLILRIGHNVRRQCRSSLVRRAPLTATTRR